MKNIIFQVVQCGYYILYEAKIVVRDEAGREESEDYEVFFMAMLKIGQITECH